MLKTIFAGMVLMTISASAMAQTTKPSTQPTIETQPAMELAGIAAFGKAETGIFARLWHDWEQNVDNQPGLNTKPCYGLALILPTSDETHQYEYMACGKVTDAEKLPKHLLHYSVPAGEFAVFKVEGNVPEGLKNLGPTIDRAYHQWLPTSGYEPAGPFNLERYNALPDGTTIEFMLPIKKKA